jgi:transcriptional regulator with XRE-family HTH domain
MASELAQRISARVGAELNSSAKTQEELAKHLGVTQPMISRRLAGKYAFPLNELPLLAGFFGITVADLCDERGQAADNSGQHSVSPAPTHIPQDPPKVEGDAGSRERLDRPAATQDAERKSA